MSNLNKILTFEYENAYDYAYDLQMTKNYSTPKIYTANGDLNKRWYVYFSYRNPSTGKLKRVTPVYGVANKYKTKEDRMWILIAYRKKLQQLLKLGYNPFEDNSDLFDKINSKKQKNIVANTVKSVATKPNKTVATDTEPVATSTTKTLKEAFDFALNLKKNMVGASTYNGYCGKVKALQRFVADKHPHIIRIDQLTKSIVVQFLNTILHRTSARSRNNYRIDLSSLMQTLADNEIIPSNFIKSIPVLKAIPERNKTYTEKQQKEIYTYLEEKDPTLLLFIKFVSYNFLRPIEVCRIQIKDINLAQKTISFRAKNKPLKTKIIPDILLEELPDLSKLDPEMYLFTPEKIGGYWDTAVQNKRDYFSKRFKKVVKEHFGLGKDYGLYSFRHTYITKLYRELVKNSSPFEAKSKLMLITGHTTMVALDKYLRDIDAELPEDYSALIR